MPQPGPDSWMTGGPAQGSSFFASQQAQPEAPTPQEKIPLEVALSARDGVDIKATNPITTAAAPLLILLGRLRLLIVDMHAMPLMGHVAQSITNFERAVIDQGIDPEQVRIAKYALCATADDIVQNLPGQDRHVWMQYSMLAQFFQVRTSGVGFFDELNKLRQNPALYYDLLELMHACLSLGFEGQYRGAAGGDVELSRLRRDIYQTLRNIRARSDDDISPRWRGLSLRGANQENRIPLWAIASMAGCMLVGLFVLLRLLLSGEGNALAATIVGLHPDSQVGIERAAFSPPYEGPSIADTAQLDRIRGSLEAQIAEGTVSVEPVGDQIVIQMSNLILFATGKAVVKDEFKPVAKRVTEVLDKEPGPILVIGHTDNVPLRSKRRFKSNFELSVARAKAVETVILPYLNDPARIQVSGKGPDQPIADNKTAEGRAKNRRVEIMIPKEETLR
ncbi:MAG: type VI secretion system protein TssL, long form [Pseudomonadota bacterium]